MQKPLSRQGYKASRRHGALAQEANAALHEARAGHRLGQGEERLPLVVDMDGTLIKTDLLAETANSFLVGKPLGFIHLLAWLAQGRAVLKSRLAQLSDTDPATLPYNHDVLTWLRAEKAAGRRLVLATAADGQLARRVSAHLGLFDEVLSSDEATNLKSGAKRDALVKRFGTRGFSYIGNGWADLPVWRAAAQAHIVSRSRRLVAEVRGQGNLGRTVSEGKPLRSAALLKAMRPQQWMKNLLIFIPLLAAHRYDLAGVIHALLAFLAFGLAASSVYLLNDLIDLADDRHHPHKRQRPFAAGHLALTTGWIVWPILLILAFSLSILALPKGFTVSLAVYMLITGAYSLRLKRIPMVDVMTLAALYTLRIVAGAAAISVALSFWLLSFSLFIFLSLALIKRYKELKSARDDSQGGTLRGRGYDPRDLELVATLGGSAGYTAVLVLALYIQDSHTAALYASPQFIWLACPTLLFWVSRAWLITSRGQMHDDPVVFALKDPTSWAVVAVTAAVFALAKFVS